MVYLKSVENVITLGKLIGLLFLFCLPLLSILFLKTKRNDLARPVMGTIFLVIRHFSHTHYLTPDQYFTSLFGPDPLPSSSGWKLSFSTSMLQHFTAESSRELRRNAP